MRRVVAVEVEAAFADGDAARMHREVAKLGDRTVVAVARMVRVHAGGAIEIEAICDFGGKPALQHGGTGHDERRDARSAGTRDDGFEVVAEACMREVRTDVDELHEASIASV